jgi:hypothetical protein
LQRREREREREKEILKGFRVLQTARKCAREGRKEEILIQLRILQTAKKNAKEGRRRFWNSLGFYKQQKNCTEREREEGGDSRSILGLGCYKQQQNTYPREREREREREEIREGFRVLQTATKYTREGGRREFVETKVFTNSNKLTSCIQSLGFRVRNQGLGRVRVWGLGRISSMEVM